MSFLLGDPVHIRCKDEDGQDTWMPGHVWQVEPELLIAFARGLWRIPLADVRKDETRCGPPGHICTDCPPEAIEKALGKERIKEAMERAYP